MYDILLVRRSAIINQDSGIPRSVDVVSAETSAIGSQRSLVAGALMLSRCRYAANHDGPTSRVGQPQPGPAPTRRGGKYETASHDLRSC